MDKEIYREKQICWYLILIMGIFPTCLVYKVGDAIWEAPVIIILSFIILLLLSIILMFFQMRTTVYNNRVEIQYGIGIVKRVFLFKELSVGKFKKIPWYYGAGIKYYGGGTLYSINFTNAAEFRLKYQNKHIAIGSKSPTLLLENISKAIKQYNSNN